MNPKIDSLKEILIAGLFAIFMAVMFTVAVVSILRFVADGILYAVDQNAKAECIKLQDQATQFRGQGFYITQNEKDQCDYYHITIAAPVGVRPLFND